MILSILLLACLGFLISLYAYFTETKLRQDANYKPVCDISDKISCSKPIKSEYGKLFYFSNTIIGLIFYAGVALLAFFDANRLIFVASLGSVVVSVFLAYILYFKIKSICLICTSIYVVNIVLFLLSLCLLF